jgi:hypothetical protein
MLERELELPDERVTIRVWRPEASENDPLDHVCRFSVQSESGSLSWDFSAHGVDGVQAILIALTMIGDRLASESDDISFLGEPGSGLPRTVFDAELGPRVLLA